jgi:hypothetical protein
MLYFKAKLRRMIKKPMNERLAARIGGRELLEDFYLVFTVNSNQRVSFVKFWPSLRIAPDWSRYARRALL